MCPEGTGSVACLEDGGRPLASSGGIQREKREGERERQKNRQTDRDKEKETETKKGEDCVWPYF